VLGLDLDNPPISNSITTAISAKLVIQSQEGRLESLLTK